MELGLQGLLVSQMRERKVAAGAGCYYQESGVGEAKEEEGE